MSSSTHRVFVAGLLTLASAAALSSCGARQLISTPNLYIGSEENPFADVPEAYRNNKVDVLYATDRKPEPGEDGSVAYGAERSRSLAFGSAVISIGDDVSWDELVAASRTNDREVDLSIRLASVTEHGRFPDTPLKIQSMEPPTTENFTGVTYDPEVLAERARVAKQLVDELSARLANSERKDVYIYVHGYNNTFEDAVTVIGEMWHFLGRQGVPIAYTWPAGIGGMRGYFYDRESGEFTIFHLKEFVRVVASCPDVNKIHLIAHSRGTDVLMTAARELIIEQRRAPPDPQVRGRFGEFVLAAPDLDLDVVTQRITAEELPRRFERLTVYMSTTDVAIGISTWLFRSSKRIGRIDQEDMLAGGADAAERSKHSTNTNLIDSRVDVGFVGHNYFYSHPAVLSDLILILRDRRLIGAEHGRPLEHTGSMFWRLDEGYLEKPKS